MPNVVAGLMSSLGSALLLLYEPFVYGDDQDDAFQLSLAAADSILRITEQIYAHSRDEISFYYTQINYCWMVCSRTLIRAMRFREAAGDAHAASIYRQQVEFLLVRVTHYLSIGLARS